MKFKGSRYAAIVCTECQAISPPFRVYLYEDDEGDKWNGKLPDGWATYDEAELLEGSTIVGNCRAHRILIGESPQGEEGVDKEF